MAKPRWLWPLLKQSSSRFDRSDNSIAEPNSPKISRAVLVSRVATYVAVPLALIFGSMFVGASSYSAFSDTSNTTSSFSSGKVLLTASSSQPFWVDTSAGPNSANSSRCINVTNNSTLPTTVKLYATTASNSVLNQYLTLNISVGSGALGTDDNLTSPNSCTGVNNSTLIQSDSLSTFINTYKSYSTGYTIMNLAPGQTSTLSFYMFAPNDLPNTSQGLTSQWTMNWEAQSN